MCWRVDSVSALENIMDKKERFVRFMSHDYCPDFWTSETSLYAEFRVPFDEMTDNTIKTVCAWCKKVIRDGDTDEDGHVSHGICEECAEKLEEDEDEEIC